MTKVLLCDLLNDSLKTVRDVLERDERKFEIVTASSCNDAIDKSRVMLFDLVFLDVADAEEGMDQYVQTLQHYNLSSLIIAVGDVDNEKGMEIQKSLLKVGVSDYINRHISAELMTIRLHNYFDIITLKKANLYNHTAINLFDKKVYNRTVMFNMSSKKSLVEFWDYFIQYEHYKHPQLGNATEVLYGLAGWLYRNHEEAVIYLEENQKALYLTLMPIDIIHENVIEHVIEKHAHAMTHKIEDNRLSICLQLSEEVETVQRVDETATLAIDDEKKKILGKTHFNKTTAVEFVESTAISLMSKIDALEDVENRMDEVLISFENEPGVEKLKEVSNAFIAYGEVVELMVEFDHLVYAIRTLAEGISNITQDQFDEKSVKKFVTLCLNLVHDLAAWRENIFIKQEANDIHYLDSSLLSSCLQIESIFTKKEIEEEEDDFELF